MREVRFDYPRDPTIDANFEEHYDLPHTRRDKWKDRMLGIGGVIIFSIIVGVALTGWVS